MRVLYIAGAMPSEGKPGTLAPVARQIKSLAPSLEHHAIMEITGRPVLKYSKAVSKIRKIADQYDILHAHYGLCGFSAVRGSNTPVVVSLMGSDIQDSPDREGLSARIRIIWEHMLSRYACRKAAAVIVKNRNMAEILAPIECEVVPNGVDVRAFSPVGKDSARASLGISIDETVVLFGGNPLDKNKNYSLASKALEVAEGILGKSIRCVPLRGIRPAEVPLLMNACDCMLFTSLEEGSPNVVKEAMACNAPIVSVPVGDTEFLLDGVEGCRLCPYDHNSLGEALTEMLERDQPSEGREAITVRKLDMDSVAERIVQIYRKVLNSV